MGTPKAVPARASTMIGSLSMFVMKTLSFTQYPIHPTSGLMMLGWTPATSKNHGDVVLILLSAS